MGPVSSGSRGTPTEGLAIGAPPKMLPARIVLPIWAPQILLSLTVGASMA